MRKIKPGDKIKVVSAKDEMSPYLDMVGKTYIVKDIKKESTGKEYVSLEDSSLVPYLHNCELVEKSEENKMTLDDLETGMRLIARDGSQFIVLKDVNSPCYKNVDMFISIDGETYEYDKDYTQDLLCEDDTELDIVKIYAQNKGNFICCDVLTCPVEEMDLIWERKENRPILTDKEKKYLTEVIRPFRDRVKKIIKQDDFIFKAKQYIQIQCDDGYNEEEISLPYFKSDTMYLGMKTNKSYTLKELELNYE